MSAALDLLAALVLEDGRRWGEVALPFQWADAEAVLDESGPPLHFLTRGRGGAKTSDLAGIAVAAMLEQAPAGAALYAAAADRDQARLFVDSVRGYVERTPEIRSALKISAYKVTSARGVVLEVLAADAASSWGLRPWLLLVDEVCQWPSTPSPRVFFEALSSAVAKSRQARMVLLSSAGDPGHWSRRVLEHALVDELWRVHEVPGPVPWLDPGRVEEQRRRLPESSFRRLFLNEWASPEDALVDPDDLAACVVLDGPQAPQEGRRYVIGLDVGLRHDATVASVCHVENDVVVLDRLASWKPSRGQTVELAEVEEWLALSARAYQSATVVYDPWQAIQLSQRLRERGVRTVEFAFSQTSVGRLATTMMTLLSERRLALPDDETLLDELRNVRLRETAPGVLRIDHDPDKHDDHVLSLALAAHHLVEGRLHGGTVSQSCVFCGQTRDSGVACACFTGRVVRRGDLTLVGNHYADRASVDFSQYETTRRFT